MKGRPTGDHISSARKGSITEALAGILADDPEQGSIISSIEAEAGTTKTPTSSPSARSTIDSGMPTGDEPADILLTLPKSLWLTWLLRRLALFQDAVVAHAQACQRIRPDVKSSAEAEWQATVETDGILRAVVNEQEVYKWVLKNLR